MQRLVMAVALCAGIGGVPTIVSAHCDGLDGPVVKAAERALAENAVERVLIWVPSRDEAEIRAAFARTRDVRELSPTARELADRYFFELVVRLHRAAEGAAYTGLKPAGLDTGPAIPAADKALQSGSAEQLLSLLQAALRDGLDRHFHAVLEAKNFAPADIPAGREFVRRYVEYVHYVERLYEATRTSAHGHFDTAR